MYKKMFNECATEEGKVYIVDDILDRFNNTGLLTHEQLVDICRDMLGELLERKSVLIESCLLDSQSGTYQLRCFSPASKQAKYAKELAYDKYLERMGCIEDVEERADEFNSMLLDLKKSKTYISQYLILQFWHFVLKTFEGTDYRVTFSKDGKIESVERHIETLVFK
jgi:hypothetical protein